MTALSTHALALAGAGIPVFPCVENGKRPAVEGGFQAATTDPDVVAAWWRENPNYNIGVPPDAAGWGVIDIEHTGQLTWQELERVHGSVPTYEVETPRGGFHLYYRGRIPSSVQKLGEHVDTRGVGGYVLVPPSVVDGKRYRVSRDVVPADMPEWIATALGDASAHVKAHENVVLDQPANVERAKKRLKQLVHAGRVAVKGSGGDALTYQVAAEMMNLGLSEEMAGELILLHWYPHCDPCDNDDFIRLKVHNAAAYMQNEAGAWASLPTGETFGQSETVRKLLAESKEKKSRFALRDEAEQDTGADPEWLLPEVLPLGSTVLLLGPTQSYKSFIALEMALSIAAGRQCFGADPKAGVVVYAALEGRHNIEKLRRRAWRTAREIEGPLSDFYTCVAPMIGFGNEMQEFGDEITAGLAGRPLRMIVIDTAAKSMAGMNENDSKDAGAFVQFCASLAETFGCTVMAVHHMGKDTTRGARGSTAFHAGFDSVIECKKVDAGTKAVEVWVRKHKDAEERETPWTFRGRKVGQSLVFDQTSDEEHRKLLAEADDFSPVRVGRALIKRGACTRETAVTTAALAVMLLGVEAVQDTAAQRELVKRSKKMLKAYCDMVGEELLWYAERRQGDEDGTDGH